MKKNPMTSWIHKWLSVKRLPKYLTALYRLTFRQKKNIDATVKSES